MGEGQRDLFGKKVKPPRDKLKTSLLKNDRITFKSRLDRLRFLESLLAPNTGIFGSMEGVSLFGEARLAYLNGAYIATILVCQAFIEHC